MDVDEKYLQIFEDLHKKYSELQALLSSVEVASDPRLAWHYQKESFKIQGIAELYDSYVNELENAKIAHELASIEKSDLERSKINTDAKQHEENAKELMRRMQISYAKMQPGNIEKCKIELVSKSANADFLAEFEKILTDYLIAQNCKIESVTSQGDAKVIMLQGNNVCKDLSGLSGTIKKVKNGAEQQIKMLVFERLNDSPEFSESDFKVQTTKSSGAGGQHINKTESAVRVTHIPSGLVCECQDERSQQKNKERAIENLKIKILQKYSENCENFEKLQRNSLKNAIFSDTASLIFDFDANTVSVSKSKKSFKLQEILGGKFELIVSSLRV